MYLGAYQLGDRVLLPALNSKLGATPANPVAAPRAVVYAAAGGTPVGIYLLPPPDLTNSTGLFAYAVHLDARYAAGDYAVWVCYTNGSTPTAELHRFTVLAGGHGDGTVIAMYPYHRPQAEFLIQQLDSGQIKRGRNPSV